MPPDGMIGGILFFSCLLVCLSVCLLSTLTFIIYSRRSRLHLLHTFSTNDALSNDTKVNDLVTLTLTFLLRIAFSEFVTAGGIVFHKHIFLTPYRSL